MASWHMDKNLACSICIFSPNRKPHCMEDSAVEEVLGDVAAGGPRKAWEASGFPHSTGPVELFKSWPVVASVSPSWESRLWSLLSDSAWTGTVDSSWTGTVGYVRGTVVLGWTPPNKANWQSGWKSAWPRICAGRPRGRNRPAVKLDMKLAPQWEHVLACQASPRAVQVCRHHKQ